MKIRTPRHITNILCLIAAMACGTACQDEDTAWDAYEKQLCEVRTDADGQPHEVNLDDGTSTTTALKADGLTPDSVYRAMAVFTRKNDGNTLIHALENVMAPYAKENVRSDYGHDAVIPLSCWRSAKYVNLRIAIERSYGHTHNLGFAHEGIRTTPGKKLYKTLEIRLLHDDQEDRKDYRQEIIIICPTGIYSNLLQHGRDSVRMTLPTEKGHKTYTFPF